MKVEINKDSVFIAGVEYVPKASVKPIVYEGDVKIVILQRGWIFIGRLIKTGNKCMLINASCIRIWGTTNGLSELVNGATSKTVLDKCEGTVEFDWLTVVATITVNPEKWRDI